MSTSTSSLPPSGKDPPSKPPSTAQAPISQLTNPNPSPAAAEQHPSSQDSQPRPASQEPAAADSSNPIRPEFTPFFTLISDSVSGSIHHPVNVHYIFSDDDAGALTPACMHTLTAASGSDSRSNLSSPTSSAHRASKTDVSASASSSSSAQASRPASAKKREERFVVLDVNEAGDRVVSAHSLTPNWQLLSTEITKAPTWDGAEEEEEVENAGKGLMLKIEGTDGRMDEEIRGEDKDAIMAALMDSFDAKMSMLRKVVEAGGEIREPGGDEQGQ